MTTYSTGVTGTYTNAVPRPFMPTTYTIRPVSSVHCRLIQMGYTHLVTMPLEANYNQRIHAREYVTSILGDPEMNMYSSNWRFMDLINPKGTWIPQSDRGWWMHPKFNFYIKDADAFENAFVMSKLVI